VTAHAAQAGYGQSRGTDHQGEAVFGAAAQHLGGGALLLVEGGVEHPPAPHGERGAGRSRRR
jgi:hypothetical protein